MKMTDEDLKEFGNKIHRYTIDNRFDPKTAIVARCITVDILKGSYMGLSPLFFIPSNSILVFWNNLTQAEQKKTLSMVENFARLLTIDIWAESISNYLALVANKPTSTISVTDVETIDRKFIDLYHMLQLSSTPMQVMRRGNYILITDKGISWCNRHKRLFSNYTADMFVRMGVYDLLCQAASNNTNPAIFKFFAVADNNPLPNILPVHYTGLSDLEIITNLFESDSHLTVKYTVEDLSLPRQSIYKAVINTRDEGDVYLDNIKLAYELIRAQDAFLLSLFTKPDIWVATIKQGIENYAIPVKDMNNIKLFIPLFK